VALAAMNPLPGIAFSHRRMSLKPGGRNPELRLLSDDVVAVQGRPTGGIQSLQTGMVFPLSKLLVFGFGRLTDEGA
jgi:hypothetical protein